MLKKWLTPKSKSKPKPAEPQNSVTPKGAHDFLTAPVLLTDYTKYLRNIRLDVGATREFYDKYYLEAIYKYIELLQLRPYSHTGDYAKKSGAIEVTIKRVAICMKLRLGYLLPLNVQSEEIAERKERWTYGVFVAALLREMAGIIENTSIITLDRKGQPETIWNGFTDPVKKHYRMSLNTKVTRSYSQLATIEMMRHIIPKHGMEWLYEDIDLMSCLLDTLSGERRVKVNPLYDICIKGSTSIKEAPIMFAPPNTPEEEQQRTREHVANLKKHINQTKDSLATLEAELNKLLAKTNDLPTNDQIADDVFSSQDMPEPPAHLFDEEYIDSEQTSQPELDFTPISSEEIAAAEIKEAGNTKPASPPDRDNKNETAMPETKAETNTQSTPELKAEPETQPAPEPKAEPKAEIESQPVPESKPETKTLVTHDNIIQIVKQHIENKTIAANLAYIDEQGLPVLIYPAGFKLLSESPNNLLNELKSRGRVKKEGKRTNKGKAVTLSDH